jgi:DNA primase
MSAAPPHRSASHSSRRGAVSDTERRDRLEAFHATLSDQVLTLTSSSAWTDWLRTAARFHHYSFRNTVAIWLQRPDATQVAGYRTWQSLGRQVRKGEHGIQILAPVTRRKDEQDAEGNQPDPSAARSGDGREGGKREEPGSGPGPRQLVGVRIAHVFDYSQTEGDPLPQLDDVRPTLLTGQAPEHLWDGLALQVAEAGYRLSVETPPGATNGLTMWAERQVLVRPELEDAQQVKTLAHELGHVMLHEPADILDRAVDLSALTCRGQREVEAESVAFLVTSAHGMDPGQYSFPYVAGWAQNATDGGVETTLRETASRALSTAHRILDRLDRNNGGPVEVAEDAIPTHLHTPRRALSLTPIEARHLQDQARTQQPAATGVGR